MIQIRTHQSHEPPQRQPIAGTSETTIAAAMALDVPDLILKLQNDLRAAAGVPTAASAADGGAPIPALSEVVTAYDPSPPDLRCGQCRGRLLRGVLSTCCVYCGAHQNRDESSAPSISFISTLACRGLLDFLQLDGSETISFNPTEKNSSRKKGVVQESLILSDLLNLDLKWPKDSTKREASSTKPTTSFVSSTVNLAGVDLDNFFTVASMDSHPTTSKENEVIGKEISYENSPVPLQESVNMFESIQSSDMPIVLEEKSTNEIAGSFSAWEADFQSAEPATSPMKSKTVDSVQAFPTDVDATTVDSTAPFNSHNNSQNKPSGSVNDSDNLPFDSSEAWNTSSTGLEFNVDEHNNSKQSVIIDNPHADDKWSEDDIWSTFDSSTFINAGKAEDKDSFDVWQDFASSGPVDIVSSSQQHQSNPDFTSTNGQALDPTVLTSSVEEFAFDGFPHPDHSVVSRSNKQTDYIDIFELESFSADGSEWIKAEPRAGSAELVTENNDDVSNSMSPTKLTSSDPNVEMLLSQMHDLSFMLADKLSIPEEANDTQVDS